MTSIGDQPIQVKNANIQILRAVAIIMVVMQHYKFRMPTPEWYLQIFSHVQFWTGVDIFLAISGYLMCASIIKEAKYHSGYLNPFVSFIRKRLFRLLPVLVFWGAISVLTTLIVADRFNTNFNSELKTFVFSVIPLSNFYLYHCAINGFQCANGTAGVTWSLSLEWQLYVILSLIVLLSLKRKSNLPVIFLSICVAAFLIPAADPQFMGLAWWVRPVPFFLGSLIFCLKDRIRNLGTFVSVCIGSISFYVLVTTPVQINYHFVSFLVGLSGAFIFLVFVKGSIPHVFDSAAKALQWVGDRSYSIYLCHIPVMLLTATFLDFISLKVGMTIPSVIYLGLYIPIMLYCASNSFRFIEQTGINIGKRYSSRAKTI